MDDYELINAQTWDENEKPKLDDDSSPFEWQEAGASKKKAKKQQQPTIPPRRPNQPIQPARPGPRQPRTSRFHQQKAFQGPQRGRDARSGRLPPEVPTQRRRSPKLVDIADNDAQYAWRERKPATAFVEIPAALIMEDRGVKGEGPQILDRLALEHGAFVHSDELKSGNANLRFGIWGDIKEVAAAKDAIRNWANVAGPSSKSELAGRFPKVVSLTEELRKRAERQWKKDIKKNRYRQFPPSNMAFETIGTFHWPSKNFPPDEAFGRSCEALDPIRMECECYIKYSRERSLFQICGKASDVRVSLMKIRRTCFQMAARAINPVRAYALHWRGDTSEIPSHVYLEEYYDPSFTNGNDDDEVGPSHSPRGQGFLTSKKAIQTAIDGSNLGAERIRVTIANALSKLHYYRGHLQLRLRLGSFVLGTYKEPEDGLFYSLAEYEEMTRESQFKGRVTSELGNRSQEHKALSRLHQAPDLLVPPDFWTQKLSNVRPNYSAVFTFHHERGDLRLSLTWNEAPDQGGRIEFTEPTVKWSRLDRDTGRETRLLDMSLTDLGTSSAFQFDILATETVEELRIPINLKNFAERARIDPAAALHPFQGKPFVVFNPYVQPKTMRQSVSYQYGLKDGDFSLEIRQFQDRVYTKGKAEPAIYEPRWSVNAFRIEWDTMFGQNERLPLGEAVEWDHEIETWFPKEWNSKEESNGFAQLLEKLERVEAIVREPVYEDDADEEDEEDFLK